MTSIELILYQSAIPLATLVLALILLYVGRRAKVLDDHPTCRRCGYDLFGAAPGSTTCPECGSDVTAKRAVVIGRRERRTWLVVVAAVLFLASVAGLGILGKRAAVAWEDDANKPAWWHARQLANKNPVHRDRAFVELLRRFRMGALSPAQVARMADGVLAIQGDQSVTWRNEWGDFLESARLDQKLSEEQWRRYARQGVVLTLINRKVVRRGDPMPIQFKEGPSRVGELLSFTLEYKARDVTVDGRPVKGKLYWEHMDGMSPSGWGSMTQMLPLNKGLLDAMKDGPHRVEAVFDIEVYPRSNRPHPTPPIVKFSETKRLDFELVAGDAATVEMLTDPVSQGLVEQKVRVAQIEFRDGKVVHASLVVDGLPFDFAAEVVLRADGREWPLGRTMMDRGSRGGAGASARVKDFDARVVDVVVRGSGDAARTTPHVTQTWGGEVRFQGVAVIWTDKTGKPIESR